MRSCRARPGNVRPGGPQCGEAGSTVPSSHGRGGLEGVRPSSSHTSYLVAAACISPPLPTAHHRSRKLPPRYRFLPPKRSGGSQALQLPYLPSRRGSPLIVPAPDRAPQKSEISAPVPFSPIAEVWRAPGPPAPSSIVNRTEVRYPVPVLFAYSSAGRPASCN